MPYGYSATAARDAPATGGTGRTSGGPHRRLAVAGLLAAALALCGTATGLFAGLASPAGVDASAAGRAVEAAFVAANVLEQNLGAPAPAAHPSAAVEEAFALASHGARRRPGGPPAVLERSWTSVGGELVPLARADARVLLRGQVSAIDAVFSGRLRRAELAELRSLVAAEEEPVPDIASPGGARVVRWYSVTAGAGTARAEATVERWERQDHLGGGSGAGKLRSSVVSEEVDALARLVRTAGGWRVVSLAEAPWQEPT